MKPRVYVMMLIVFCGHAACARQAPDNDVDEGLSTDEGFSTIVAAQSGGVYAALFSLSETRDLFLTTAGEHEWSTEHPSHLHSLLNEEQRRALLAAAAEYASALDGPQREAFLRRLERWILVYHQIEILNHLSSLEEVMGAVFAVPLTTELFRTPLEARGLDLRQTRPESVGATLSAAEISGLTYQLIDTLVGLGRTQQIEYFHEVFQELSGGGG